MGSPWTGGYLELYAHSGMDGLDIASFDGGRTGLLEILNSWTWTGWVFENVVGAHL